MGVGKFVVAVRVAASAPSILGLIVPAIATPRPAAGAGPASRADPIRPGQVGHARRAAAQLRQGHPPDARRLPVDRHAGRPGALRRRAVHHLRQHEHAGAAQSQHPRAGAKIRRARCGSAPMAAASCGWRTGASRASASRRACRIWSSTRCTSIARGRVWAGTFRGGLAVFDGAEVQHLTDPAHRLLLDPIDRGGSRRHAVDRHGRRRHQAVRERAGPRLGGNSGLPSGVVWPILHARDGSVWIGTYDGLAHWTPGPPPARTLAHERSSRSRRIPPATACRRTSSRR